MVLTRQLRVGNGANGMQRVEPRDDVKLPIKCGKVLTTGIIDPKGQ